MKQFSKNDGQCFGLKLLLSINLRSNFKLQFIDWPTNLPIRQAKVRWKLKVVHSRVKMMHTMSQNWGTFFTQLRKGNLCFTVENKKESFQIFPMVSQAQKWFSRYGCVSCRTQTNLYIYNINEGSGKSVLSLLSKVSYKFKQSSFNSNSLLHVLIFIK